MSDSHNYSDTLSLPKTEFGIRADAARREPEILAAWEGDYLRLRQASRGREGFVLHDGPPYANGRIHIGHALNKIIKDIIVRHAQQSGYDAHYVPGWDCHGLPIEWAVERQYREHGTDKAAVPVVEFRRACRHFARGWVDTQKEQFKRLGVRADWNQAYETMSFENEAIIAERFMEFVKSGLVYQGSRPVLWSTVEQTALADAEVEYQDVTSDTVYFAFKLKNGRGLLRNAKIAVYTTTPWTVPANRAIAYSRSIAYGLYRVTERGGLVDNGSFFLLADKLAADVMRKVQVAAFERVQDVSAETLDGLIAVHPFRDYGFDVPLLEGDHVTDDLGTGFVHTAPSHGSEDFHLWCSQTAKLDALGIDRRIPMLVGPDGAYTDEAGELAGQYVYERSGKPGKANQIVVAMLMYENALLAGLKLHNHPYPHSWRSGAPLIYRHTPQWFIAIDGEPALRANAQVSIEQTQWVPNASRRRISSMMESRPDWLVSRQRSWGVPLSVFTDPQGNLLIDNDVNARILAAYREEGADAWFADGARERFLGDRSGEDWQPVMDVLDVWFDSGCTHLFGPQQEGRRVVVEGSDQHRGWFQSSLLANFGRAPYDTVITHGFVLDTSKQKMSKKIGNVLSPDALIRTASADILRLWVASSDYQNDVSISPETIKTFSETYRKLRNTLKWMLGVLAHYRGGSVAKLPLLEQYVLDRTAAVDEHVQQSFDRFDFKAVATAVNSFASIDLSSFYFDVRKDSLYCDAPSSETRKASLETVVRILARVVKWIEPILPFLVQDVVDHVPEQARVLFDSCRSPGQMPRYPEACRTIQQALKVREQVLAALEAARAQKLIGSPLEASVDLCGGPEWAWLKDIDLAELCVVSRATFHHVEDRDRLSVEVGKAEGTKCARSWKYSSEVGSDPDYPDVSPRDAAALREIEKQKKAA